MPNHVTNELVAARRVLDAMVSDGVAVDFNVIVPMPELLQGESELLLVKDWAEIALGIINLNTLREIHQNPAERFKAGDYGAAANALRQSNIIRLLNEGPFPKDFSDADFELMIKYMRCLKTYGCASWYDWSVENWGTKWNAYQAKRIATDKVRFQTAWSAPVPVIDALSKRFPEETIRFRWADEDFGSNTGDVTIRNGEVITGGRLSNGSREAKELALELLHDGGLPEYMRRTSDGNIVYVDDD